MAGKDEELYIQTSRQAGGDHNSNVKEIWMTTKRPNLRIYGIKGETETDMKENLFNDYSRKLPQI